MMSFFHVRSSCSITSPLTYFIIVSHGKYKCLLFYFEYNLLLSLSTFSIDIFKPQYTFHIKMEDETFDYNFILEKLARNVHPRTSYCEIFRLHLKIIWSAKAVSYRQLIVKQTVVKRQRYTNLRQFHVA